MVQRIRVQLKQEFRLDRLLPSLSVGLVAGALDIMLQISFALLIFSGSLSEYVGVGIGLTLFAGLIIGLVVALTTSLPGMVAVPQDSPAAVLAVVGASIVAAMPAAATAESTLATVVAAIALTSLLTGVFLLLLGWLKQGSLVRFIPYPVIGGFLAGTGWLLVQGGIGVMADVSFSLSQLPAILQPDVLLAWLPGLVFAVLLLLALRRFSHFWIMPAMLVGAIALFYLVLLMAGLSVAEAAARGWLLGPFPEGALWQPLTPTALTQVHWPAILGQLGNVGTILIISVVSLLLNASGVELIAKRDVDLNRELKAAGLGNLLSGLGGGGPVGYHALAVSALSYRSGALSRLVGVIIALLCGLLLLIGPSVLSLFPTIVLGALVLFLGLSFLVEWLYDGWFKLSKTDYAIVVLIMVAMNVIGVLEGVGLGFGLAVVLFVVDYGRVGAVRHTLSGTQYQSNVDRPRLYQQLLRQKGDWLYILELQGFLFFGTAHSLFEMVQERISVESPKPKYVILDFRRVSGMDASAVLSFARMVQLAEAQGFALVFTHVSTKMQRQLTKELPVNRDRATWHIFPDLDHGVEWCEDQMIQIFQSVGLAAKKPRTAMKQLEKFLSSSERFVAWQEYLVQDAGEAEPGKPDPVSSALAFMEQLEVKAGEVLICQGEQACGLYFVERGQVTIQLESDDGPPLRLRTRGEGAIVGEMGLYLGSLASASVVVDEPSTLYYLSVENLKRLEVEAPETAAAFHKFIAQHLSERLLGTTQTLQALLA